MDEKQNSPEPAKAVEGKAAPKDAGVQKPAAQAAKPDADDKPAAPKQAAAKPQAPAGAAKAPAGIQLDPSMSALSHVPVEVQVVLGGARMPIGNILKLGRGAVVEIDRKVGEQVDIHINHRPVARGEIIIVDEDRLGVTLTEIINVQAGLQ